MYFWNQALKLVTFYDLLPVKVVVERMLSGRVNKVLIEEMQINLLKYFNNLTVLYLYFLHCIAFPLNQLSDHTPCHTQAVSSVPTGNHFLCLDLYLLRYKPNNFHSYIKRGS